jgi:teichuronic acid biosynthesis glycosyltransferase TuaH
VAPVPGDWSGLVVVCGAVPWHGSSRMLDQHLAAGLTRYAPVLYIDAPVPWRPGRARSDRGGLQLLEPGHSAPTAARAGLALAVPHVPPGHQRPGMKAVALGVVRRTMRQALRDLGSPSVQAVIVTSLDPCFGVCGERRKVFYASDDFVAGAELMRLDARRLDRAARRQPRDADLVVAASPALADTFRERGVDPLLLPNGCDPEAFAGTDSAAPAGDVETAGGAAVAGFMGHLSSRIDVRYLDAVAERGHRLLLVGPGPHGGLGPDLDRLVQRPNVQWVGPRAFEELPSYLRHVDVGLVPYTDTPFNHASFPLKALEYLAAGRPVLSTDIGAIHWLREGHNVRPDGAATPAPSLHEDDIVVARSPEAFADQAERLLAARRTEADAARRLAFARAHSWDSRFAVLAEALGLTERSGEPVTT